MNEDNIVLIAVLVIGILSFIIMVIKCGKEVYVKEEEFEGCAADLEHLSLRVRRSTIRRKK